ncbi:hypothetical protein D3C86_2231230 [compost metagenome]
MLVGIQAAVFVVVMSMRVVVFVGLGDGQGQQGKRQGKQQATHVDLRSGFDFLVTL